jgi:hypothetical protein
MTRYTILRPINLGLPVAQGQCDYVLIDPTAQSGLYLDNEGKTIWVVDPKIKRRSKSVTTGAMIDLWVGRGDIRETEPGN